MNAIPMDNPFLQHVGVEIETWSLGRSVVVLTIGPSHLNRSGIVHGGLYTVLCDTAGGLAGCYSEPGRPRVFAYTVSLSTNFVAKARSGRLRADGRVQRSGKQMYFSTIEVHCGDDLVALGQGSFMLAQHAHNEIDCGRDRGQ